MILADLKFSHFVRISHELHLGSWTDQAAAYCQLWRLFMAALRSRCGHHIFALYVCMYIFISGIKPIAQHTQTNSQKEQNQ